MTPSPEQVRKLRQGAFVYLHVGVLYEAAVVVISRQGLLPAGRGPLGVWLVSGAAIVALIFWGLWFKRSVWLARGVWGLQLFRLPALIQGAFFPAAGAAIPTSFYLVALAVVLFSIAMMARAGWDL